MLPSVNILKKKPVENFLVCLSETSHITLSRSLDNMQKSNVGVQELVHVRI